MADDIVDELRQFHHDKAADEIERLRAYIDALLADRQLGAWKEARRD